MMRIGVAALVVTLMVGATRALAQEPKLPEPQKEHEWLAQLAGEWESESELVVEPGKPAMKCHGTESVRAIGGFWIVAENKANVMGKSITGLMTVGFDPDKKKYVGTWIDSQSNYLWKYVGTLDSAGKVLTLEAEGPNFMTPGKMSKFRDVIEVKGKDQKILRSSIQGEDGKWVSFMTVNYRRKK